MRLRSIPSPCLYPETVPLRPRGIGKRSHLWLLLWGLSASLALAQAIPSFTSGTFTNNSVLALAGPASQQVYGVTFGDSSSRTTANGYVFGSCVLNNNPNVNYVGSSYTSFLSGGGTSGDTAFNGLLNTGAVGGGATGALTLKNLIPNATYRVLFLEADTRTGLGGRAFTVSSGGVTSASQTYSFVAGTPSLGGYVLATFTATGTTQVFNTGPAGYGYQLNGILVTRVDDTALQPVVTDGLPVFTSLTAYNYRDSDAISTVSGTTTVMFDQTLYAPFDTTTFQWWDNLVSELVQARLPVVMFATRGANTTDPNDLINGLNPRLLRQMIWAMQRNGVADQFKLACFVDCPALSPLTAAFHGVPSNTSADLSVASDWDDIWWQRAIKPWFDTVPSQYWYRINGQPVIQTWGIGPPQFTNIMGNAKLLLSSITTKFHTAYGVDPVFILDKVWPQRDPSVYDLTNVIGVNPWFSVPTPSYGFNPLNDFISGTMVPGFTAPNYYDPSSSNYNNPNAIIPRNGASGTGALGDTLIAGLNAAAAGNANFTVLEGWNDVREFAGIYRSTSPRWAFPNQYINIVSRYTDLRTVTRRLEAEACDEYGGASGNPGGAYRRTGTLGIRGVGGLPVGSASSESTNVAQNAFDVNLGTKWYTGTTAPGWIQYNYGTANKATVASYALTSADLQGRDPKSWQFQGSNDGLSWTTLDTQTNQTFTARLQTISYTCSNTTAYQYYRLNITANYGGSTYGLALAEMQLTPLSTAFSSGWFVTGTAASEWLQFDQVYFTAGNYKFPVRYSSTASHTLQLSIDGVALPSVVAPSTGSMDTFGTVYLGTKALAHGVHTLKVVFVDGGVDLDWLFVKKYDPLVSFKSALTNCYLTASGGGGGNLVSNQTTENNAERFSIDDQAGAGTITSGDTINLQAYNGLYLTPASGGGAGLTAKVRAPGVWENLTIVKTSGTGALASGMQVAVRTSGGYYLTAKSDGTVDATGTTLGTGQTFTINLSPQ